MQEITDTARDQNANVSAQVDLSLVPKDNQSEGGLITSWQLLDRLIPRGLAQAVAYDMHCAIKYVNAWCRKSEGETASGQRNPIDRVCQLIAAVHRINALGSAFIVEFIVNFHRQLTHRESINGFTSSEARRDETAELLIAATNCVNSLNTVAATDESLFALVELRERCERAIDKVQIEIVERARQSRTRSTK